MQDSEIKNDKKTIKCIFMQPLSVKLRLDKTAAAMYTKQADGLQVIPSYKTKS